MLVKKYVCVCVRICVCLCLGDLLGSKRFSQGKQIASSLRGNDVLDMAESRWLSFMDSVYFCPRNIGYNSTCLGFPSISFNSSVGRGLSHPSSTPSHPTSDDPSPWYSLISLNCSGLLTPLIEMGMSIKEPKNLLPGLHFKGTEGRGGIIEQTECVYRCMCAFRGVCWFNLMSWFW